MSFHIPSLLVVLAASLAAPLIGELTRRFGLSIVVLELALGVAIGPHGLGWASVEGAVPAVASIGMAFLFFLAGLEIELGAVRGRPIVIAVVGWIAGIAAGLAMAFAAHRLGMVDAWIVVGLALSTTALGVLVPILRDSGSLDSAFGCHVLAVGAVGELGPILLMSFLLSRRHDTALQSVLVMAFLAIVLVVAWALVRGVADPPVLRLLRRTLTQASQLPVRGVILLLGALIVIAENLGIDFALGAIAAGMLVKLATHGTPSDLLHHKLDAIGFGFLVPVFFISSGMKLDIASVFGSVHGQLLTATLLAAMLVVRLPLMIMARSLGSARESVALGLYGATTLSLIVAITDIAAKSGAMTPAEVGPLVIAGVLSVVLFPIVASGLLGPRPVSRGATYSDHDGL
ncbi:MAG: cation:proton antiporter [Burkholderiales bacterium]